MVDSGVVVLILGGVALQNEMWKKLTSLYIWFTFKEGFGIGG